MEKTEQNTVMNPGPALLPVAQILVNVLLRRLAEDRADARAEKT